MNRSIAIFFWSLILLMLPVQELSAQLKIERKIIIENGKYYFFTIDEETQLATLYSGDMSEKLIKANKRQIPIGREQGEPLIPMSFDINGNELIGINWILNSNNVRYHALKKMDLRDWKKGHSEWTNADWLQVSFDQPVLAANEPWQAMLKDTNVLENTCFDLIKTNIPVMAICNRGKLWIWQYNNKDGAFEGRRWVASPSIPFTSAQSFSLLKNSRGQIGILDNMGNIYRYYAMKWALEKVRTGKGQQLLIVDKDHKKNYTIPPTAVEAGLFNTLTNLINTAAQEIIF